MSDSKSGKSLVLVVGAGASHEAGLPVGAQLKRQIANLLDFEFDYEITKGDHLIATALRMVQRDIAPFLRASHLIRDAMPQAISIDNFIDAHRSDENVALVGKLAIVRCILEAEAGSPLKIDRSNIYNKLEFAFLEQTWFNSFFQLLTENCQQADLAERFSKVAIICFNYDRCIEHYLHSSLQNYYGMPPEDATALVDRLEIHHPYGVVGKLPWQDRQRGIDFGAPAGAQQLLELAKQIRTFTEGTDSRTSDIVAIRNTLSGASRIAFLGFAYHRLNLELLFPPAKKQSLERRLDTIFCSVYGTALNISAADIEVIVDQLRALAGIHHNGIKLDNSLTSAKLFSEFWRSLAIR